ncbi:hypothetical protein IID62_04125 [candidate division KSB1 bacterium]|nr:hypothetical protein [candidate division KSB1 bacterium]
MNRGMPIFQRSTMNEADINKVKHKTFVEANEEGTAITAVTSAGIAPTSSPPAFYRQPLFCLYDTGEIVKYDIVYR